MHTPLTWTERIKDKVITEYSGTIHNTMVFEEFIISHIIFPNFTIVCVDQGIYISLYSLSLSNLLIPKMQFSKHHKEAN